MGRGLHYEEDANYCWLDASVAIRGLIWRRYGARWSYGVSRSRFRDDEHLLANHEVLETFSCRMLNSLGYLTGALYDSIFRAGRACSPRRRFYIGIGAPRTITPRRNLEYAVEFRYYPPSPPPQTRYPFNQPIFMGRSILSLIFAFIFYWSISDNKSEIIHQMQLSLYRIIDFVLCIFKFLGARIVHSHFSFLPPAQEMRRSALKYRSC